MSAERIIRASVELPIGVVTTVGDFGGRKFPFALEGWGDKLIETRTDSNGALVLKLEIPPNMLYPTVTALRKLADEIEKAQ